MRVGTVKEGDIVRGKDQYWLVGDIEVRTGGRVLMCHPLRGGIGVRRLSVREVTGHWSKR